MTTEIPENPRRSLIFQHYLDFIGYVAAMQENCGENAEGHGPGQGRCRGGWIASTAPPMMESWKTPGAVVASNTRLEVRSTAWLVEGSEVDPKVSVIIPTYNRWELLRDALESVFRQTYPHWEAIVVNDAGNPPAGPAAGMLRRQGVVYIEHPERRGPSASRNTGLSRSTGEFVAYLDDDDIFYPDHLEILVREMTLQGWDVAYSDAVRGTYELSEEGIRLLSEEPAFGQDFTLERFWRSNFIPLPCVVHRRSCIEQVGNFDPLLPAFEDWDLLLRMSSRYAFRHVSRVTCMFRVRINGSSLTDRFIRSDAPYLAARVYAKYVRDLAFRENPEIQGSLAIGVYRLFRNFLPRFVGEVSRFEGNDVIHELFRFLPWWYKVRLSFRRPLWMVRYCRA